MGTVGPDLLRPTIVTRGTTAQRPWAATLAAIGAAGRSGQLTLRGGGKVYKIAFAHGIVVGAASPIAADSVARVALAQKLVTPPQAQVIAKTLGKAGADDVDRFAAATKLPPGQVLLLKRRVIVERTARTFDVEDGDYTVEDKIDIPVLVGVEVDVRAAIAFGVRKHQSQERLLNDLRQLGARFVLRPGAEADLARFDFADEAQPVLDALRADGTSMPELEALHRDLDPRMMLSVLVALASCDVIIQGGPVASRVPTPQDASLPRTPTPHEPTFTRVPTPRQPTLSAVPMLIHEDVEVTTRPRARAKASRPPTLPRAHTYRAVTDPFLEIQATTQLPNPLSFAQVKRLIASRAALLGKGVDHFEFLGIPFGAPISDVRAAYLELARYLRPERLKEMGIADAHHDARSVFAQVVIAYTVLTDPHRRADYLASLLPGSH